MMKRLVVASLLLAACADDDEPLGLANASLTVKTEKAQTDNYVDFGEPRFVVTISSPDGCYESDTSLGGTFRGVQMEVLQRGHKGDPCTPAKLAIAFDAVMPTDEMIEVHDKNGSVSATFASGVLDVRTANFGWTFQAGNTNVMGWSHPIAGTPRMSFCIPTPNGGQLTQIWNDKPTGTVTDQIIHFSLPAQVEFTGTGEAMIEVDGASGAATSCTGSACAYELEYFVIHSAIVNP